MAYLIKPVLKEHIWAGTKLKTNYNKKTENEKVSESWEFSYNDSGVSTILNNGNETNLKEFLLNNNLGDKTPFERVNILLKLINSGDNLSVQVHPSDKYAQEFYNSNGKTEAWYIIDSDEDGFIYLGFNNDYSKEEVEKALNEGTICDLLNKINVKPGDFYFIPSGTIHAIGKGVTLYEIQENSDLTFRLFDYNRLGNDGKPRELHIKQALDCLNYKKLGPRSRDAKNPYINVLTSNHYFELIKLSINKSFTFKNNNNSFSVLTILDENVTLNDNKTLKGESYYIEPGEDFTIKGKSTCLLARIPDLALGLDVGGTSIKGAIIDDLGNKVCETKVTTESELGEDKITENMAKAYFNLCDKEDIPHDFFESIGIGFPGNINCDEGIVNFSNNLGLRNYHVKEKLNKLITPKIYVDNDANCAALGEYFFTEKKKYHDMAFLTLGTGLGSGFIINSKLFRGGLGSATELGHTRVKNDSFMCTCGHYGCLESLTSLARIKRDVDELLKDESNGLAQLIKEDEARVKIFQLYDRNEAAKQYTDKYLRNLSLGLINVCNLLQPEIIVIGGGVSYNLVKHFSYLEYRMNRDKYSSFDAPKIKLVHATLGNDAGSFGAAALTKQNL